MKIALLYLIISSVYAIDFNSKMDQLLNNDVELIQQKQYLNYFSALEKSSYSRFVPSLSLNANRSNLARESSSRLETYRKSIDLSMDLFNFGRDYYLASESNNLYKAQEQKVSTQLLKSQVQLSELLFSYIEASKAKVIREQIIDLKNQSFYVAKKRYQSGQLSKQELDKVEIDLNNTRALLENTIIDLNSIISAIAAYGDISDLNIQWPYANLFEKIPARIKYDFEKDKHPSFLNEKFSSLGTQDRKKSAISNFFGKLSVSYSKGELEYLETNNVLFDESIVFSFSFPLFNNYNDFSLYKKAVADEYVQLKQFEITKRYIGTNYQITLENLQSALKTYRLRNSTLKLSTNLFNHSLKQFKQGRISVNELILDQDRLLQTQLLANSGAMKVHQAYLKFCSAVGKSFQENCLD